MKLHTCLTSREVGMALERAQHQGRITQDMQFAVFTPGSSLTHQHGYEIQLGTYDQDSLPAGYADQNGRTLRVRRARNASHGSARWAATWHEWGWLIAEIFAVDPGSQWGANPARSRHPWGYFSPEDFHAKTGGQFRTRLTLSGRPEHLQETTMTTLHAFREDGTEVQPGETVPMAGVGRPFTFRAALIESNDSGTSGMIAVDGYPDMFSAPFGLTVRAVSGQPEDPAWEGSMTGEPGDIRRDIRGPGGFQAIVGNYYWMIIDSSDGEIVTSKVTGSQEDGKQAVLDWEREHGLVPETWVQHYDPQTGVPVAEPAPATPATLDAALAAVNDTGTKLALTHVTAVSDDSSERDAYLRALENLADEVRSQLSRAGDTDELAAEADHAARTTAPPVPGVTQNAGHTVYAVIRTNHVPGESSDDEWVVAAANDREHVTWTARTCEGGTLAYNAGRYHVNGEGSGSEAEALVDLADRAGVFSRLTELSSGTTARAAFQDSHAKVLEELSGTWGVGRARVRSGLLEAAALGYARVSWHADSQRQDYGSQRQDYGIRYDRVSCVFTWAREHN